MELAVAALSLHRLELVIPPATAHEFTAVHALRGLIAKAALSAQGPSALVAHAVVRAGIDVDQVVDGGCIEAAVHLHQLAPAVEFHGSSAIIFLLQGIAYLAEISKLQPTGLQATGTRDTVALTGHVSQVVHSSSPGLVVVQVHHDAGALVGASLVNPLTLPGVNKLLGEAVSVFDVIPAATPKPVPGQVFGPCRPAAAAGGELALPAGTAHGVDHPGCANRIGERRLPAAYLHDSAKHRVVVHSAAIPSSMSELILALLNARLCTLSNELHMVLIQLAEFLLSLGKPC